MTPCLRGEFRLPLLVSSRAGYQNLCRLITKMKLRAKKGEGAVSAQELEEHAAGLICLTGGAGRPAGRGIAARRQRRSPPSSRATHRYLRPQKCLRRTCSAISSAKKNPAIAPLFDSPARSIFLCSPPTAYATPPQSPRTLRRLHRHPPSSHALYCRTLALPQLRTSLEISRRRCSNSSPICPKQSAIPSNSRPASNSRSTISATNSRAIPCPKARP